MQKSVASGGDGDRVRSSSKPRPDRDAAVGMLENSTASVAKKSPRGATLLKESLRSNLPPTEASAQLRVLCRKFAALSEKVKEETKLREEAQREVRRLSDILEGHTSPVVSTCRADSQALVRELKEANERLKTDLRLEQDKNGKLVTKALELEREKSALLASHKDLLPPPPPPPPPSMSASVWDKEQVQKIQETLKTTIDELQDELTRKEEEVAAARERFQRERGRVRALEEEIRSKEEAERAASRARQQLEQELRQAQTEITCELENVQRVHERAQEDRAVRETLERQLETLSEVNAALEQRCRALVRRLELSASAAQQMGELKMQLRDAEVDNETLVRTIRELKEQQFERETQLKTQLEQLRGDKQRVEAAAEELQTDLAAVRAQNSLFSEWMLVRNENTLMAQRGDAQQQQDRAGGSGRRPHPDAQEIQRNQYRRCWVHHHTDVSSKAAISVDGDEASNNEEAEREPSRERYANRLYVQTAASVGSPGGPRSASAKRVESWRPSASRSRGASSEPMADEQSTRRQRNSSPVSTTSSVSPSSSASSVSTRPSDHDRLRALMSRNRELQHRLQQETMATQSLEREISDLTCDAPTK